jgi:hypothetical protein
VAFVGWVLAVYPAKKPTRPAMTGLAKRLTFNSLEGVIGVMA